MADGFSHIESALGIGTTGDSDPQAQELVQQPQRMPVVKIPSVPLTDDGLAKDLKHDYETVRNNLRELVDAGKNALDGVMAVAQEGDQPRAYEVVAQLIKTLSETNRDLLEMHDRVKSIRKTENNNNTTNNTTNNAIYVGSTRELQDIINSARSTKKAFVEAPTEDAP
jgi:hypothetical protein